ncbi:hypothetical protein EGW08_010744, partial [Elysia chlorotica]
MLDQSPKRVRFCSQKTEDRQPERCQDSTPPTPRHSRQSSNEEQHPSRLKLLQWMRQKQQQQQQLEQQQQQQQQQQKPGGQPSGRVQSKPILRHKSLPASLNSRCERPGQQNQQGEQVAPTIQSPPTPVSQASSPPQQPLRQMAQSPSPVPRRSGISLSHRARSSESVVSRTPPVARRHATDQKPSNLPQRKQVSTQQPKSNCNITVQDSGRTNREPKVKHQ